jgi:hypothetical protein
VSVTGRRGRRRWWPPPCYNETVWAGWAGCLVGLGPGKSILYFFLLPLIFSIFYFAILNSNLIFNSIFVDYWGLNLLQNMNLVLLVHHILLGLFIGALAHKVF